VALSTFPEMVPGIFTWSELRDCASQVTRPRSLRQLRGYCTMRVSGMDREAPLPAATKFTV
jgi:hypothetical protein